MIKHSMKKVIIASLAFAILASLFVYTRLGDFWQEEGELERYVYPSDFSDCWSVEQRRKKCRIPEEVLSEMTVEELVWAVIDYPFLFEVLVSSQNTGWSALLPDKSNAFAKLIECRRPEGKIIKVLKEAWEAEDADISQVYLARQIFYDSQERYFDFSKKQLEYLSANEKLE
ncbi:MAG: hypothetical protein K2N94_08605 [Lachnospiraceae bacterium]|nr:hypothetical protein [Lachnospiraceae bacterium]